MSSTETRLERLRIVESQLGGRELVRAHALAEEVHRAYVRAMPDHELLEYLGRLGSGPQETREEEEAERVAFGLATPRSWRVGEGLGGAGAQPARSRAAQGGTERRGPRPCRR